MLTKKDLVIYSIDEVEYFDSADFCRLIQKSKATVNYLIREGNKIRKLKCLRPTTQQSFIPVSELTEFPFTTGGPGNRMYHYDEQGNKNYHYDEQGNKNYTS